MMLDSIASPSPPWATPLVLFPSLVLLALAFTRLLTDFAYKISIRRLSSSQTPRPPVPVPYTIPFLGHALQILSRDPGRFWLNTVASFPILRQLGAYTIRLANRRVHVLTLPIAINHLFRAALHRRGFNRLIFLHALGVTVEDDKLYSARDRDEIVPEWGMTMDEYEERLNATYLLRPNTLIDTYVLRLRSSLDKELADTESEQEVNLNSWLREHMFKASISTFMGDKILEMIPSLEDDFFAFERDILTMFFGIPRWIAPGPYAARDSALGKLEKWQESTYSTAWPPADPDGEVAWEPNWGSRLNRARQFYYEKAGISFRSRAGFDLGFIFGLATNVVPATAWMLAHLLDPRVNEKDRTSTMQRVMDEIQNARLPNSDLDIHTLTNAPLLNSIFTEVLRLYVDFLVTRELDNDLILPLDDSKAHSSPRHTLLPRGGIVMAPTWLGHHDAAFWADDGNAPPHDVFYPERFYRLDPETGKGEFSTQGATGKLFPFGGGTKMCPGRVFAKQETFVTLGYVLLGYEVEVLGFVDAKGKETEAFPGLRAGYTGTGVIALEGDVKVRLRRRKGAGRR
jgi:hypothetical protein